MGILISNILFNSSSYANFCLVIYVETDFHLKFLKDFDWIRLRIWMCLQISELQKGIEAIQTTELNVAAESIQFLKG